MRTAIAVRGRFIYSQFDPDDDEDWDVVQDEFDHAVETPDAWAVFFAAPLEDADALLADVEELVRNIVDDDRISINTLRNSVRGYISVSMDLEDDSDDICDTLLAACRRAHMLHLRKGCRLMSAQEFMGFNRHAARFLLGEALALDASHLR